MKTSHKITPSDTKRFNKFGHATITLKKIKSIFKSNQPLQNPEIKSYETVGFTRIEKEEALKTEVETRRNQGRVYANITPIR